MSALRLGDVAFRVLVCAIILFLVLPVVVTMVVSFNAGGFVLPPTGFSLKWYEIAWSSNEFISGIQVSLILGVSASLLANIVAFMLVLSIYRYNARAKQALTLLAMSPLLVPMTILGLSMYIFLAQLGLAGGKSALLMGHVVLTLPFAFRILTASFQNYDGTLDEAAANVGASPVRTLFSITLPIIKTGLIASFVLCFIISWNDFALSVFLAPSDWTPLPIQLYSYIKFQYDAAGAALVSTLVLVSAVAIVLLDRLIGLQAAIGGSKG
mgnify:CR=1 FL=1|jgi:ABC-type spermidine/putrescine transport system, permease component II